MMTIDQAFDAGLLIDEAGRPIVSRKQLADAKWITVHPNGAGTKGTPVQISENGTVLAGMGGKFNGKKLGELKGGSTSAPLTPEQRNDIARSEQMFQKYGEKGEGARGRFKEAARAGKFDHLHNEYTEQLAASKAAHEAEQKAKQTAKNEAWKSKNLPKLAEAKRKREEAAKEERAKKLESAKRYAEATAPGVTKTYLNVPFHMKEQAKAAGAFWDPDRKKWFVGGEVPAGLKQFAPSSTTKQPSQQPQMKQRRGLPTSGKIGADDPSIYGSELLGYEGTSWSYFLSTPEGRKLKAGYEKAR